MNQTPTEEIKYLHRRNQIPAQDESSLYRFLHSHEWEIHLIFLALSVETSIG